MTRGTTYPNRLRRIDRWIVHALGPGLRRASDPVVVDLGFGASPVTTVELARRLRAYVRPDVSVVGLEIAPQRVADAAGHATDGLGFGLGGFELPLPEHRRPALVRALNVLRQYDEAELGPAWRTMVDRLAPGGALIEGTCSETGRRAAWVTLHADDDRDADGVPVPRTLTLAAHLATLDRPGSLAERLPKALIHRNVPGEPIHDFLNTLDEQWARASSHASYGARQRFRAAAHAVADAGWPLLDGPARWRQGELTVAWPAVAPSAAHQGP